MISTMEGRSVFAQSSPLRGSPGGSSVSLSTKAAEQSGLLVNTSPLFAGKKYPSKTSLALDTSGTGWLIGVDAGSESPMTSSASSAFHHQHLSERSTAERSATTVAALDLDSSMSRSSSKKELLGLGVSRTSYNDLRNSYSDLLVTQTGSIMRSNPSFLLLAAAAEAAANPTTVSGASTTTITPTSSTSFVAASSRFRSSSNPDHHMLRSESSEALQTILKKSPSIEAITQDLPVTGAPRYDRCGICLQYGHMAPVTCCNFPRHMTCEAIFQAGQRDRWIWESDSTDPTGVAGVVIFPCSTCRRPWRKSRYDDELLNSVCVYAKNHSNKHMTAAVTMRLAAHAALEISPHVSVLTGSAAVAAASLVRRPSIVIRSTINVRSNQNIDWAAESLTNIAAEAENEADDDVVVPVEAPVVAGGDHLNAYTVLWRALQITLPYFLTGLLALVFIVFALAISGGRVSLELIVGGSLLATLLCVVVLRFAFTTRRYLYGAAANGGAVANNNNNNNNNNMGPPHV